MFRTVGNESIPLREIAELGYMYNGWQIVSVRANTQVVDQNITTVQLVENGMVYATQINPGNQIVLYPNSLFIDANTQNIELRISGYTHIESISVELRNVHGYNIDADWGYAQYVDIDLNVDAYTNSYVNLNDFVNLSIFSGRILERVNVIAELPDQAAFGTVTNVHLLTAQQSLGVATFNSYDPAQVPIWTDYNRWILGQNVLDLAVYADNAIHMDRVILKLK